MGRLLLTMVVLWGVQVAYAGTLRIQQRDDVFAGDFLGNGIEGLAGIQTGDEFLEIAGRLGVAGLTQGDMMLGQRQKELFFGKPLEDEERTAIVEEMRWPEKTIYYKISLQFSTEEKNIITRAMEVYHEKTCLKFVELQDYSQTYYLSIFKGMGCYSYVGRTQRGGQLLSLGQGCVYTGTILHELMHAAGFLHEQSRTDRDQFITVNYTNIARNYKSNFQKHSGLYFEDIETYDLGSIMHYGARAFAMDRRYPTIIVKDKKNANKIGNRKDFSEVDVAKLNRLYSCPNTIQTTTTTTTTTAPGLKRGVAIEDKYKFCPALKMLGVCTSMTADMAKACPISCGLKG